MNKIIEDMICGVLKKITADKICMALDKISAWSLYIMIFTLPFAKSIIEITIVVALVSLILKKIIKRERLFDRSGINLLLAIFLIASLLSFFNTSYMKLSMRAFFSKSLKFAALFLITQEIINTKEKLNNFLVMALLSCGIIIVDGLLQYQVFHADILHNYTSFGFQVSRLPYKGVPTASFPFPNDYAAWLIVFIFPVGIYAFFGKSGFLKSTVSWLLLAGLFYSLMLTRVRGAFLGFFISFGIFSIVKLKRIGIFLLIILALGGLFINRSRIADMMSMTSVNDRGVIWKNSVEIFKKHPIIGNGLNTFYVEYMNIRNDEYKGTHGSYAHNCYLQMAADIGLVGLIAFILFVSAVIIKGFRAANRVKEPLYYSIILGTSLGMTAFLIHSSMDTNLYSLNLSALFWLAAGLLMAAIKISNGDRIIMNKGDL